MRYLCVASSESLRTAEQGEASWNESTDRALAGTKLRSCHSCVMPRQAPSSLPEPQHAKLPARRWNLVFLYPLPISQCLPPSPISASPAPPPALHHCLLPASAPETSVCYLTRPGHGWIKGCLFPQDRSPCPCSSPGLPCCLSRAAGHSHGKRIQRVAARASPVWWLGDPPLAT